MTKGFSERSVFGEHELSFLGERERSFFGEHELDAAGIDDPCLRASYRAARTLNAAHGRTYHLATRLLPPSRRPFIHALYGFARSVDDIVDVLTTDATGQAERLARIDGCWQTADSVTDREWPVLPAFRDTLHRHDIDHRLVEDFLTSMRQDLTVDAYDSWDDLLSYMHGSAAVIGLQVLPVLGTQAGMRTAAEPYARDLGLAFQLTNIIRDVGEDLRRGRVYLPVEDLARVGLTRADLAAGVVDGRIRRLLAAEVARTRELLRNAAPGIRLLDPASQDCVRTAATLYAGILDAVEAADYRVLDRRVAVGAGRRLLVAAPGLVRAWRARH